MKIIGISGSPTAVSRSGWLLDHFLGLVALERPSLGALQVLQPIVVRDLPAQALTLADFASPDIREALARVAEADIVIISTPIYKAAYSGLLKIFLDLLPQDGLQGKTVVALATGGSVAHLLAVDYALKPVLSALGTRDILDTVFGTDPQLPKQEGGGYASTPEIDERLARAADNLFKRITPSLLARQSRRFGPHALPPGLRFSA